MAPLTGGTDDRGCTDTGAGEARVGLGAEIAIIARCAVGQRRIGAHTGGQVASAGGVTLIGSGADDGIGASAGACEACVGLCAHVAVVARCAIGG